MDGSFSVDPDGLRSASRRIGDLRPDPTAPNPAGAPWGDDEAGRRFAAHYGCAAEGLGVRGASLVAELRRVSARLIAMAEGYERADEASAPR